MASSMQVQQHVPGLSSCLLFSVGCADVCRWRRLSRQWQPTAASLHMPAGAAGFAQKDVASKRHSASDKKNAVPREYSLGVMEV